MSDQPPDAPSRAPSGAGPGLPGRTRGTGAARETLEVRVGAHAGLGAGVAGTGEYVLRVRRGTTLGAVLAGLGVDLGCVGVASAGGRLLPLETVLEEDCAVDVYPLVGGG